MAITQVALKTPKIELSSKVQVDASLPLQKQLNILRQKANMELGSHNEKKAEAPSILLPKILSSSITSSDSGPKTLTNLQRLRPRGSVRGTSEESTGRGSKDRGSSIGSTTSGSYLLRQQYRSSIREQVARIKLHNQQVFSTPSIIDDIFESKQGKLKDHALGKLTTYLIDHVEMFKKYPIKAIEEIASRLDNRVYNYKDVISRQGEPSSEVMIIYHGEVGLYKEADMTESVGNLLENSVIGTDEVTQNYTVVAHTPRVKVLVLHKMFLKDTLFYVQ